MKQALFISFHLYICFIEFCQFVLLYFFVHALTVSYNMYKNKNACTLVHLQIDALYSIIKYLFYIS